jgi:ribosomal protein L11 methyltransferase
MNYTELKFIASSEFSEILMAELAEIDFETFTEEPNGLNAYIPTARFVQENLDEILLRYRSVFEYTYNLKVIEKQNWNADWEKNYPPIRISNLVLVRASFHEPDPKVAHDIIINPKMSFGTGHHETTAMVMEHQLEIDHFFVEYSKKVGGKAEVLKKSVLDIGCGTGILAILAEKLGAKEISAFDIEEWAAVNSKENAQLNQCKNIFVRQGTIETEPIKQYDIVLANINRNILLRDINQYINYLKPGGIIIISGFYTSDQSDIEKKFGEFHLKKVAEKTKNNWASIRFVLDK